MNRCVMKMKIFQLKEDVRSYTYSILKIIVCVVLIVLLINRDCIVSIENETIDLVIGILCAAVGLACILCIYISFAEMIQAHDNRKKETVLSERMSEKNRE